MADYIDEQKVEVEESSGFDYRLLWSIIVLNWYWLVASVLVCVAVAFLYLRYQTPVFQTSAKVLIKDDSNNKAQGMDMTLDQLGIISNSNGFENELEIISSTSVATRAVRKLKLYVSYYIEGRVTEAELYKNSPILVDMEEHQLDQLSSPIVMQFTTTGQESVKVEIPTEVSNGGQNSYTREIQQFPAVINTRHGQVMLIRNPGVDLPERQLTAIINPPAGIGRSYAGRLAAQPTSKFTTVAVLSILDTQPNRAVDYLAELVNAYNEDANEDKNEVAEKTREFLDERIQVIQGELDEAEVRVERYKLNNKLVNLPTDATQAVTQTTEFQKKQVDIQTQMSLVQSLIDYMKNPANNLTIIPVNIGITNSENNKMVADYNALILKRNRMVRSSSEDSPAVIQVTEEAQAMWDAVEQNLRGIFKDLQIQKKSVDKQYDLFAGRMGNSPIQERAMNDMGRQQQIKAQLYLMLAERREENYISLASTANKARVIDMPQVNGQVSPKSRLILMAAFVMGLFLPLALFYLRELLHFRVEGRADLEKLTKIPIVADIPLSEKVIDGQRAVVVKENKNDMMEESFRGLRTNLRFLLGPDEKVICCTSCVPGEGKTFVATNLAMSLALLGKRVIIVGLDVRKPRLVSLFGLSASQHGITTYLANNTPDFDLLEEQISKSVLNPNLDVLPAGVIPPNPGELITRDLLDQGIDYLKTKYDYIILDTPPVGLVSDTYELSRLVDVTFFVVRNEVTTKAEVDLINRTVKEEKLPKVNIVFNGLNLKKRKYGFYYGYGKYSGYHKYGTYYGRYGHYGTYGNYGEAGKHKTHLEK